MRFHNLIKALNQEYVHSQSCDFSMYCLLDRRKYWPHEITTLLRSQSIQKQNDELCFIYISLFWDYNMTQIILCIIGVQMLASCCYKIVSPFLCSSILYIFHDMQYFQIIDTPTRFACQFLQLPNHMNTWKRDNRILVHKRWTNNFPMKNKYLNK